MERKNKKEVKAKFWYYQFLLNIILFYFKHHHIYICFVVKLLIMTQFETWEKGAKQSFLSCLPLPQPGTTVVSSVARVRETLVKIHLHIIMWVEKIVRWIYCYVVFFFKTTYLESVFMLANTEILAFLDLFANISCLIRIYIMLFSMLIIKYFILRYNAMIISDF